MFADFTELTELPPLARFLQLAMLILSRLSAHSRPASGRGA